MKAEFSEGDWVYYYNPGHQWHMMMFQLVQICPTLYDHINDSLSVQEYVLRYGGRQVIATYAQMKHRNDSVVQSEILNVSPPNERAFGEELDNYAQLYGVVRKFNEPDAKLRERILNVILGNSTTTQTVSKDLHAGHDVVENFAGGKAFKYCRKCKVEVLDE